ncbi:MAG: acetoacetyl-CoA reductase [Betaproteobacteria bacterium]|jgi:acetoacetyl-CoA reductase|nr:acetoacetyl-CoA reductase [Betaproteobacteria bacterium]
MSQRIAVVTGGTGGIGTAICKKLAAAGHKVWAADIADDAKGAEWVAARKAEGFDFGYVRADVTDTDGCAAALASIGQVDILVNNAGITRDAVFKKLSKVDWDAVMGTNLDSVFNMTKPVIDGMLERGWGRIINISSINGQKGQFGQTNYSAAKAGMHGFTKALAQETAKKGITVNTISPGYIGTDMVMAIKEEIRDQIIAGIPVGRLGKPDEIAALVTYLASEDAGFITGSNVAINGGQHMF